MQKVLYWQDVLGNSEDLNQYQGIISKLLNGDYKEADLEKLAGHNVYSVRVNKSDRLLFTTVTVKGKSCLLLLDVVLNHDYHKSRFLKPQVLRQFLEQNVLKALAKEELAFVKADALPPLWANPKSKEEEETIEYQKVTFYNQTFITLSDAQEKALKTQLPAVISGAAGSGKSCVALAILEQAVTQFIYAPEKPLLYITQSANLAQTLQRMWEQLPASQTEAGKQVQFLTYQQFIEQQAKELKDKKAQDKASFMTWLNHYIGSYNNKAKAAKKILAKEFQEFLKNTESIYQAFRYLSGFLPENPQGISARHDQFKNDHERQWLIEAYANYKKSHDDEKNTGFNPEFHTLKQQDLYDLIVVDEAQDLSGLQLKNLRRAAQNGQIAYCMDSNQSLIDPVSQRPLLVSEGANHIELPVTYRCPGHVVKVANAILDLKQRVTGGLADKLEYSRIILSDEQINNPGIVEWIEPNELNKHPHLKQLAQTTRFAVVTLPQFKEKAKELFGTPLVFTPEEIKGLEYPHIVLYRLFDDPVFGKANKIITPITTKTEPHRAKAGQGDESFAPPFNQVFTACTRPTESLTFVEDSSANRLDNSAHQLNNIIPPIKQLIKNLNNPNNNNNNNSIDHKTTAPASAQDWNNEAIRLRQLGKIEQANAIEKQMIKTQSSATKPDQSSLPLQRINQISKKAGKQPVPAPESKDTPKSLVSELVAAARAKTVFAHKRLANSAELETIWLTIPVPTKKRQYSNLFIYSLNHYNSIRKALGSNLMDNIYKQLFTVKTLSITINTFGLERSLFYFLCEDEVTADILHHQLKHTPDLLKSIPTSLWIAKAAHGSVSTSLLFRLTVGCPNILGLMAQANQGEALEKIPLMEWFEEYTIAEEARMTPWVALMLAPFKAKPHLQDVEELTQSFYNQIYYLSGSIPPSFSPEQLCRENFMVIREGTKCSITLLHALLFSREGCKLLKRWLDKNPESLAKIPLEYWLKETRLFNQTLTPLESLAFEGSPILDRLLQQYPDLAFNIKPEILYRRSHKGSMIHHLAANYNYNDFLIRLLTANPHLITQIPANAWYGSGFLNTTPLYWFSTTAAGRQFILFLLEGHPSLIDQIPLSTWLEHPGQSLEHHHLDKCVLFWLLKNKSYKILDLLADKLIDKISLKEWQTLITSVAGDMLNNLVSGSQEGGLFFTKLAKKLSNTMQKQGISPMPLAEPLIQNKKPPAETGSHAPQFFAPASSSKEEEASSKTMACKTSSRSF